MSTKIYTIAEFKGIDQSKSENGLNPSYSPDACNMDTENGDLAVAKGYVKHISEAIPGIGAIRRLYVWRAHNTTHYVAVAGNEVYASTGGSWTLTHTFTGIVGSKWDFLEVRIGTADYLLIANGETQMIKWSGGGAAELFGSGETVYTGTVSAYSNKVVTLSDAIDALAQMRLLQVGIIINGVTYAVASVDAANKKVTLSVAPGTAPTAGQSVRARGGLSNEPVNFLAMHYNRLFAAGDPDNPSRLYWSQPPGDYRSIEDWSADDASENTGGGFVDVGTDSDPIVGLCSLSNQLIIFKRASIYRLLGDRPSNYRVYRVNAEVEQMIDSSVILYGDTPMWLTKAGVYFYDGQTARPMGNARQIKTFLASVDLSGCKGAENRDKLHFTAREGSGLDDAVAIYDVVNRTYMIRRGFNVADLCALDGTLFMVNDARYVYRMDEGNTYDGAPIEAYWRTPLSDLNGKYEEKRLARMYLRGGSVNDAALLIDCRAGKYVTTKRILLPLEDYEVTEIQLANQGRAVSFRFYNEAGGWWEIKGGVQVEFSVTGRT